jgi:capsular polysaccharide biosynthesis protein
MLLGLIAAFIFAIGAVYIMEYIDPSFRTPQEVSETLSIPVLATMPRRAA